MQFSTAASKSELEEGDVFAPRFDADGLIVCVTTDVHTGAALMVAYMSGRATPRQSASRPSAMPPKANPTMMVGSPWCRMRKVGGSS